MDVETITKLVDAGYTMAEIEAMQSATESSATESEVGGAPAEDAGKEQSNAGAKDASEIEAGVSINAAIEALTNTVAGLQDTVKAMQTKNAESAKGGKQSETVDDVLKSFIDTL